MRFFLLSLLKGKAVSLLFLIGLLTAGGLTPMNAAAQDTGVSDVTQPDPPPPPAVFQNLIPAEQLAFLNDYAGRMEKELRKDKRFGKLLNSITPRTGYFYGGEKILADARDDVLDGDPLPVNVRDGRYVMVGTSGGGFHGGRGFVWFDMKAGIGLGGVYFHPTNGEPTPTLAIYSRQLKDRQLSMSQLPLEFAQDFAQWEMVAKMPPVTIRYFIPDNNRKYVLVHDEDYCDHPENAPAPPQDTCLQMNADAADKDLTAADFMRQTGNRTDATAYMLNPELATWLGVRTQTCGGSLACQIRVTRRRTRALLSGPS